MTERAIIKQALKTRFIITYHEHKRQMDYNLESYELAVRIFVSLSLCFKLQYQPVKVPSDGRVISDKLL